MENPIIFQIDRSFLSDGSPVFSVSVTQNDIDGTAVTQRFPAVDEAAAVQLQKTIWDAVALYTVETMKALPCNY